MQFVAEPRHIERETIMMNFRTLATGVALAALTATTVFAQTPAPTAQPKAAAPAASAPAPSAPAVTTPAAPKAAKAKKGVTPKAERSAESLACSAKADDAKIKGKERQSFRKKCIAEMKKAGGAASAPVATAPAATGAPKAPAVAAPAATGVPAAKKP